MKYIITKFFITKKIEKEIWFFLFEWGGGNKQMQMKNLESFLYRTLTTKLSNLRMCITSYRYFNN